jgi:antitoxin (DNA-binding transcriptional repressor) of toxin-antitoxin stability system
MDHMKRASIRDLRYDFTKVENLLQSGEEIQITRRKRVIARLLPPAKNNPKSKRPDFLARLKQIYGSQTLATTGAELIATERDRY